MKDVLYALYGITVAVLCIPIILLQLLSILSMIPGSIGLWVCEKCYPAEFQ